MYETEFDYLKERGIEFAVNAPDQRPTMIEDVMVAMDAQPALFTHMSNGVPAWMLNIQDPTTIRIAFTQMQASRIWGEQKLGDWTKLTATFPIVESVGEVSNYGDFNNNGHASVNTDWESRNSTYFQIILEYGDRELDMASVAGINLAQEHLRSAILSLRKYENKIGFFGIAGQATYGGMNDPNLPAPITAATKANGGTTWFSGTFQNATPNEMYNDILSMFYQLTLQTNGLANIDEMSEMTLVMGPGNSVGLRAINAFGISVRKMLEDGFPNLQIVTAPEYGALTAANLAGNAAGSFMQLICRSLDGQETGSIYFSEKLRTHRVVFDTSSLKQKLSAGSWGLVLKQPLAVVGMLGT